MSFFRASGGNKFKIVNGSAKVRVAESKVLYFNGAVDSDWNTLGNWWFDDSFTIPATHLPRSIDTVTTSISISSNSGPPIVIYDLNAYDISYSNPQFGMTISVLGRALFQSDGIPEGIMVNSGTINGNVVFGVATLNYGTINGNATFNDNSYNYGTVNGDATFNSGSGNYGTVTGNATFNGSSYNDISFSYVGIVNGNATFNDSSYNYGIVNGNATFNGGSFNEYGTVNGNATFNDSSYNIGTVTSNATFNDSSFNSGTVTGTATFTGSSCNSSETGTAGTFIPDPPPPCP